MKRNVERQREQFEQACPSWSRRSQVKEPAAQDWVDEGKVGDKKQIRLQSTSCRAERKQRANGVILDAGGLDIAYAGDVSTACTGCCGAGLALNRSHKTIREGDNLQILSAALQLDGF